MKLNRNNYEEYFILYLDNELDSESRREVEAFAQENPDLKAELDMLLQSKLTPEADISFADKDSLMRFHHSTISLANYEEWLIAYIDNELPEEDRKDAERFIAGNPSIQRELNLLQRTKLQPESIVFPYKESLYRREEKARVISISWRRIAAAAVLLLAVSTTAIVLINNNNKGGRINEPVVSTPAEKKSDNNTAVKQPGKESVPDQQVAAVDDKKKDKPNEIKQPGNAIVKQNGIKPDEKKEQVVPVNHDEPVIAQNNEKKPSNNLANPEHNSNVTGDEGYKETFVDANPPKEILTDPNKKTDIGAVTAAQVETSDPIEQPGKNKGVRGFLRKVTRTFEKRTNIKATDDDDRLLIAGLAIKL
jgi:hypothetical protein